MNSFTFSFFCLSGFKFGRRVQSSFSTKEKKNLKRNVSQTREQHSVKALTTFNNISKSSHNDTYRENNRKIERKIRHYTIRHNSEKRILCFFFAMWLAIWSAMCGARIPAKFWYLKLRSQQEKVHFKQFSVALFWFFLYSGRPLTARNTRYPGSKSRYPQLNWFWLDSCNG